MDPNNNPTPTPNPEPVMPPMPEPVAPEVPATPAEVTEPAASVEPAAPVVPAEPGAPNPAPVNPVIQPSGNPVPVNPVIQPSAQGGLAATDPIMQPERPPEPDPIEEELKAPMQPAGPVPGSIGSAVSGPNEGAVSEPTVPAAENPFDAGQAQTPSVSFNDPATQPEAAAPGASPTKPAGKFNKRTLIILIALAAVVVVALVIVLIITLTSGGSSNTSNNGQSSDGVVVDDGINGEKDDVEPENVTTGVLSCTRNMTAQELVGVNDAVSGAVNITAEFDDSTVVAVSRVDSVVYSDEDGTETEPVETEVHEAKTVDMTAESAMNYYLPTKADGTLELSVDEVQSNYQDLDFTCEVL